MSSNASIISLIQKQFLQIIEDLLKIKLAKIIKDKKGNKPKLTTKISSKSCALFQQNVEKHFPVLKNNLKNLRQQWKVILIYHG